MYYLYNYEFLGIIHSSNGKLDLKFDWNISELFGKI